MIRASHGANQYAKPSFREVPTEVRLHQVLARVMRMTTRASGESLSVADSGQPTVDEFVRRFDDVRSELVGRKLRGESLSSEEQLVLDLINDALRSTMTPPRAESERVRTAVEEADLILRDLQSGQG